MESLTANQLDDNFVQRFIKHSEAQPEKSALHVSHMLDSQCIGEEQVSYGELAQQIKHYQALWHKKGWQTNDRIIVIIKPSTQLYAIALSLLALGMIPVFIDTGMGRKKIKMAIEDANARAIISMKALLKWFWLIPPMWALERLAIDEKGFGFQSLAKQLLATKSPASSTAIQTVTRSVSDHGLISFTSGSTGRPKGADRTHYSLIQQHLAIRSHWSDDETDIDCPCFPVMVLHNLSCGMTTVMPKVDLAQPAQVDGAQVVQQIEEYKITRISGAPAYIQGLVDYSIKHKKTNHSVTTLVVGGATVSIELAKGILVAFPNAYSRIVYGSTEAEPIASIDIVDYLIQSEQNKGYLVGQPAEQVEILIADVSAEIVTEQGLFKHEMKNGDIGEILVSGKHVLKQYVDNPQANADNKIKRTVNEKNDHFPVWHRTGDTGFLDSTGQLWLTGRVKDILLLDGKGVQPYPLEQALDDLSGILRSALIHCNDALHLFVQTTEQSSQTLSDGLQREIKSILAAAGIDNVQMAVVQTMPVDGRHNSKIDRLALRQVIQKSVKR